jgi:predicted deacylase
MKRLCASLLALLSCAGAAAAADPSVFTVGTAVAARGNKSFGAIEVPAGVDAGTRIAVAVVHGARPGPVLAVVAGAHGTEYASIVALSKLIGRLDPAEVSGTVIVIPLVNVASFEQKVPHVNPVDGKNMNRFYPGRADGTQTERASFLITREVVEKCDHLIDLHGGDLDEDLRPYSYWTKTGNDELDALSREMVLAFGFDHIVVSTDRPKDPAASRYLENTATTRGKAAITVEAGRAGTVDLEDVALLQDGCLSVMQHLKMLPGPPMPTRQPIWISSVKTVASEETGIFFPLVGRGDSVEKGTKIGYVTDVFGRTVFEARAPAAGTLLYICAVPSMKKGDTIANIGVIGTSPP